jgi:predicted NAD-dependent protein-ADP-ribosyltransferase YbiA (DUF1768 family)
MSNGLLRSKVDNFFSGKDALRSLSNFWECLVVLDGREYESGEHAFHGEKYTRLGELAEDPTRRRVLLEHGRTFLRPSQHTTAAVAKRMGGKRGIELNSVELQTWDTLSLDVQFTICEWKACQYAKVRDDLIASAGKILIHPAMRCSDAKLASRIWEGRAVVHDGSVVVLGRNTLGRMWMQIRDDMNSDATNSTYAVEKCPVADGHYRGSY